MAVPAELRSLVAADLDAATAVVDSALGGRRQVRLDEAVDVLAWPGHGAWVDGRLVGLATWIPGDPVELLALAVLDGFRRRGVGALLVDAVVATAGASGAGSVWVLTTNDNLTALGLYQRQGFRLARIVRGGVDRARAIKSEIPLVGSQGIPLHDELVLELRLG